MSICKWGELWHSSISLSRFWFYFFILFLIRSLSINKFRPTYELDYYIMYYLPIYYNVYRLTLVYNPLKTGKRNTLKFGHTFSYSLHPFLFCLFHFKIFLQYKKLIIFWLYCKYFFSNPYHIRVLYQNFHEIRASYRTLKRMFVKIH